MAANGFKPVRYMNGTPYNGGTVRHSVLSGVALLCIGDLVDWAGTASVSPTDGAILQDLSVAAANTAIYGVITGFIPAVGTTTPPNLNITHGPTGAYRECWVAPLEPTLILECTANSALVTSAIGLSYDAVHTAGSTTTGASANVLDSTSGTGGKSFLWLGVRNDPANLATMTTSSTVITASTSTTPTIIEVVCVEGRIGLNAVTAGVS